MTATTDRSTPPPTVVCPAWCADHWQSDEHLGNPNNTFVHQSADVSLPRVDEEAAQVQLCSILTVEVQEVETSIFIGESSYRMRESRRLAETVLQLVEQVEHPFPTAEPVSAECPPWCVEHLVADDGGIVCPPNCSPAAWDDHR